MIPCLSFHRKVRDIREQGTIFQGISFVTNQSMRSIGHSQQLLRGSGLTTPLFRETLSMVLVKATLFPRAPHLAAGQQRCLETVVH
jgi:hypothetical protein